GEFPATKARPLPLGHEFCGTITEVGTKSIFKKGHCRKGKYHYCLTGGINSTIGIWRDGGWAQYCCVPQDRECSDEHEEVGMKDDNIDSNGNNNKEDGNYSQITRTSPPLTRKAKKLREQRMAKEL
ncbi:Zinc-containing alcohol dehydrogenase, partial [Operophtera brumata]